MGVSVPPKPTLRGPAHHPHRGRRRFLIVTVAVVGSLAALAVATTVALLAFHAGEGRPVPAFPSLAAHPDPSLRGTVAYTAADSRCVRIVAAAGGPSRDVLCLGAWKPDPAAPSVGKETQAPQLLWRSDGRLEITMFLMLQAKGAAPVYRAEWQKIMDVRTGEVEQVPADRLPAGPDLSTRPTVDPGGRALATQSNEMTGEVKVTLTDRGGTRTLMSAHGPGEYGYRLYSAFWAPDWRWVAADDGRILVITPSQPSTTRVLVDGAGGFNDFPTFAVTDRELLGSAG